MDRKRIARKLLRAARELIAGQSADFTIGLIEKEYQSGHYEKGKNSKESGSLPDVAVEINKYLDDIANVFTELFQDNSKTNNIISIFGKENALFIRIEDSKITVSKSSAPATTTNPGYPILTMTIPAKLMMKDNELYSFNIVMSLEFKYGNNASKATIEYKSYDKSENKFTISIDTKIEELDNDIKVFYSKQEKNSMFKGVMEKIISTLKEKGSSKCTMSSLLGKDIFKKFKSYMSRIRKLHNEQTLINWRYYHDSPYFKGEKRGEEYKKWREDDEKKYKKYEETKWNDLLSNKSEQMITGFFNLMDSQIEKEIEHEKQVRKEFRKQLEEHDRQWKQNRNRK